MSTAKKPTLSDSTVMEILSALLNSPVQGDSDDQYVEETIFAPFSAQEEGMRYRVADGEINIRDSAGHLLHRGTLRELLWSRLKLSKVCERYGLDYKAWEQYNNSIPYLPTEVGSDAGVWPEGWFAGQEEKATVSSDQFAAQFLQCPPGGVSLLMAEYGMGKTSFCHCIRSMTSDADAVRGAFLSGERSFPILLNLNEYRNQTFDEFVQNRLHAVYDVSLHFHAFELLCQCGVFTVVMDAWDQMRGTPNRRETIEAISDFSSLWEKGGSVLITCRRSFYQNQLHAKSEAPSSRKTMDRAKLFTLNGFKLKDADAYLTTLYDRSPAGIQCPADWLADAWSNNERFFSRPLNIQLLARFYDRFSMEHDLTDGRFDTGDLLSAVLEDWLNAGNGTAIPPEDRARVLKCLTRLTLEYGLNRSVELEKLWEALQIEESREALLHDCLGGFIFLEFRNSVNRGKQEVEFRLAAYQEYLWAHFVVEELRAGMRCGKDTLVNRYLLNPEARVWAAKEFQNAKSDALAEQLKLLVYKSFEEAGYSGGNALTLLGDLSCIPYYRKQLKGLNLTDLPLQGADLRGLDLRGLTFRRSNLRGADFSYTTIRVWDEYGKLKHCAFLYSKGDDISVVSATDGNGVLTYSIKRNKRHLDNFADDIRDIAADKLGVYTAGKSGYVGYLDPAGNLRNAYISAACIQSITSGETGTIYFGVGEEGLIRYDWRTDKQQSLTVTDEKGNRIESFPYVSDIRYTEYGGQAYIAYTTNERRELVLLALESGASESGASESGASERAEMLGISSLENPALFFSDICFAEDRLVYAIPGRGIYSTEIVSFFGTITDIELLSDTRKLIPLDWPIVGIRAYEQGWSPVELAWDRSANRLLALVKGRAPAQELLSLDREKKTGEPDRIELNSWIDLENYAVTGLGIDGLAVSDDGQYLALAGERLAVFFRAEDEYRLIQTPIDAKIDCDEAQFSGCEGLSKTYQGQFRKRGANV